MKGVFRDLGGALRFFSRLPVPGGEGDFARSLRLAPLAGALLGLGGGLVFVAALSLRLPAMTAGLLGLGFGALVTGGLHEDGLADIADGFGGGFTAARKLEIMKDSRVGAFGALALILSVGLRASALAALAARPASALLVVIAAGALSRAAALAPLALLPPARADGAGRAAGASGTFHWAFILALPFAFLPALGAFDAAICFKALLLAGVAALGLCTLARAQIGGQTGDVAGAAQQAAEITILLAFSAAI